MMWDVYYKTTKEEGPFTGICGPWDTKAEAQRYADSLSYAESYEIREFHE